MIHDFSIKKLVNDSKLITQKPKVPELIIKAPVHVMPAIASIRIEEKPQRIEKIIPKPQQEEPIEKPEIIKQLYSGEIIPDEKYAEYHKTIYDKKYYEAVKTKEDLVLGIFETPPRIKSLPKDGEVYRMGDLISLERKPTMPHLGLDIGTKTIVASFKNKNGDINYISEINGFWPFERATAFIENMLKDPTKVRSDGTSRPAHYFKHEESNQLIVLGRDAEELAYSKNDTMKRPMAEGGITPDEMSMTVLSSIIHGILETAERDVGKFDNNLTLCYCTTAPALNKTNNIEYHERVIDIILKSYNSQSAIKLQKIKESHAIVLNQSPDGSGIGISWGAGTVTVTYVKYGLEVYSFCWVGAGDWIDENVAIRHGYDAHAMKSMKKSSKETPTTVSKVKMDIDLTPGIQYADRLQLDISLHYDVLINQVVSGIVAGFKENEAQARIENGINVYMAGGTSSPKGFAERVALIFNNNELPFVLNKVSVADKPLFTVAAGCLTAAEMFE